MAQKCLDNKKKKQLKKHDRQTEGHPDRQSQLLTIMTPMLGAEINKHERIDRPVIIKVSLNDELHRNTDTELTETLKRAAQLR